MSLIYTVTCHCGLDIIVDALCRSAKCHVEEDHLTEYGKFEHPNIWPDKHVGSAVVFPFYTEVWPWEDEEVIALVHPVEVDNV